jgi:hypothetical protein
MTLDNLDPFWDGTRYPVGNSPLFEPDTGEGPTDSKGRRPDTTSRSDRPTRKKQGVTGDPPKNIARAGKQQAREQHNEDGDGTYPTTVEMVGKGGLYDPKNEKARAQRERGEENPCPKENAEDRAEEEEEKSRPENKARQSTALTESAKPHTWRPKMKKAAHQQKKRPTRYWRRRESSPATALEHSMQPRTPVRIPTARELRRHKEGVESSNNPRHQGKTLNMRENQKIRGSAAVEIQYMFRLMGHHS